MRIVHWYSNFLAGGAVANAVCGLANAQARFGEEIAIVTAETQSSPLYGSVENYLHPAIKLIKWKPRWKMQIGSWSLRYIPSDLSQFILSFSPDVVHAHGGWLGENLWLPKFFSCPIILSPHGAFHPVVLVKSHKVGKSIFIRVANILLYRYLSAIHALSPMEGSHIINVLKHQNVYVVPQGASIQVENLTKTLNSKESNEIVKFIFIGRLDVFTKGLDLLLEGYAKAIPYVSPIKTHLIFVGPDWNGGLVILRKKVSELGISNHVTFTGLRLGCEIAHILNDADIYIHLSRHEGFPLSVVEALIYGKPSILSKEIGQASYEEITNLPHVRIVHPDVKEISSAIIDFSKRHKELTRLAQENLEKIQTFFSWERVAKLHLEQYLSLCKK